MAEPGDSHSNRNADRRIRADAQRNLNALLKAAMAVFAGLPVVIDTAHHRRDARQPTG